MPRPGRAELQTRRQSRLLPVVCPEMSLKLRDHNVGDRVVAVADRRVVGGAVVVVCGLGDGADNRRVGNAVAVGQSCTVRLPHKSSPMNVRAVLFQSVECFKTDRVQVADRHGVQVALEFLRSARTPRSTLLAATWSHIARR